MYIWHNNRSTYCTLQIMIYRKMLCLSWIILNVCWLNPGLLVAWPSDMFCDHQRIGIHIIYIYIHTYKVIYIYYVYKYMHIHMFCQFATINRISPVLPIFVVAKIIACLSILRCPFLCFEDFIRWVVEPASTPIRFDRALSIQYIYIYIHTQISMYMRLMRLFTHQEKGNLRFDLSHSNLPRFSSRPEEPRLLRLFGSVTAAGWPGRAA